MGLMKPFADTNNNPRLVKEFNYLASATRSVVENANARLKNKFMRLKYIRTRSTERARLIVRTCIVLHNFIIKHDSTVDRENKARDVAREVGRNEIVKRDLISRSL